MESHLLQMRGLKHCTTYRHRRQPEVASFTDAWIETGEETFTQILKKSRIFYRCVD